MDRVIQCRRCGKCCQLKPCFISMEILGDKEKCKALEHEGDIYTCGLVRKPSDYLDLGIPAEWKDKYFRKIFSQLLGIGKYCDSDVKFIHVIKEIWGDIDDFSAENLLWSATSHPFSPPAESLQQLKDLYIKSRGNLAVALEMVHER